MSLSLEQYRLILELIKAAPVNGSFSQIEHIMQEFAGLRKSVYAEIERIQNLPESGPAND